MEGRENCRQSKTLTTRNSHPELASPGHPAEKWAIRASYGIFDAPRDAENYTDGALGLGFNPHNRANGAIPTAVPRSTGGGPACRHEGRLSDGSDSFVDLRELQQRRVLPAQHADGLRAAVPVKCAARVHAGGILLDTSYVYTRGRNLNFATDINQATTPNSTAVGGFECTRLLSLRQPEPGFQQIDAQIYDGYSNYNALQLRLEKRMSYGLSFQLNYAWSKSLDTGTGNGHGSGSISIRTRTIHPPITAVGFQLGEYLGRSDRLRTAIRPRAPVRASRAARPDRRWLAAFQSFPVAHRGSIYPGDPEFCCGAIDPGLTLSVQRGSYLFPELIGDPKCRVNIPRMWFNPAAFADPVPGTFGNTARNPLVGPGFANVNIGIAKEFPLHEAIDARSPGRCVTTCSIILIGATRMPTLVTTRVPTAQCRAEQAPAPWPMEPRGKSTAP